LCPPYTTGGFVRTGGTIPYRVLDDSPEVVDVGTTKTDAVQLPMFEGFEVHTAKVGFKGSIPVVLDAAGADVLKRLPLGAEVNLIVRAVVVDARHALKGAGGNGEMVEKSPKLDVLAFRFAEDA
jgi:hypothetical protein